MNRTLSLAAALCSGLVLGGCASQWRSADDLFGLVTPYRIEIVQGNVVTSEQMAQVQVGMPRQRVRDLLGTPLLADPFHAERWDYPFSIRRQGAAPQRRNVVLHFEGDRLARIEAPELPSELEFVASIARSSKPSALKLELSEAEIKALPAPPPRAEEAAEPAGAVRSYPPLEGS